MSRRDPLTIDQCNKIYDILVEAGASADEHMRQDFIHHFTSYDPPTEWRFMGKLGFGGKFRYRPCGAVFIVDCYSEDMNSTRRKVIDETNTKLKPLGDEEAEKQEAAFLKRIAR